MKYAKSPLALAIGYLCASSIASPALAQPMLEEVIVTAQKRVESLQDVPISIAAVSGDNIERAGITDLEELSFTMPNITITQEQISDRINIRGIASGGNQGFDQSVGLFSNGVYLARGTQFRSAFLDVGMVEILRGPQATLFGKNTIAGAVNITPRRPDYDLNGEIRGRYEAEYGGWSTSGYVTGGLTDTLAARVAVKYKEDNGWVDNKLINRDEPEAEATNYRVSFLWEPSADWSINLSHEDYSLEKDGKGWEVLGAEVIERGTGEVLDPNGCSALGLIECKGDYVTHATNVAAEGDLSNYTEEEWSEVDTDLTALNIEYQWGEYTVNSVTGWANSEVNELNPSAATPIPQANTMQEEDFESFSQELRITSPTGNTIEWLAGLYYEESDYDLTEQINVNDYYLLAPFATGSFGSFLGFNPKVVQDFEQEAETWAVFGQATWNISDTFRATLGLRYSEEEKEAAQTYVTDLPRPFDLAFGAENHEIPTQKYEQDDWSPSLNLQWDINQDIMLYASGSIGYKSGGFDARISNDGIVDGQIDQEALEEKFEFDQEKATTYELGFKSVWLDGSAELNGALFYTEYEDLQFSIFDGGLAFQVDNAAGVDLTGFEFEGRWQLSENLYLSGGGAWLDFEYTDFEDGPCDIYQQTAQGGSLVGCTTDRTGDVGPNTPEFSFNATLDWRRAISANLELQLGGTAVYEDSFYVAPDLDPLLEQDAYTKLNLRAGLNSLNGNWSIAIIANNVTDEETFHYGTDVPLLAGARFGRLDAPRTITLEGVYRF